MQSGQSAAPEYSITPRVGFEDDDEGENEAH
jgi:hypothetical protein